MSREADEIVELIKEGKPITPTPGSQAPPLPHADEPDAKRDSSAPVTESPKRSSSSTDKRNANGNCQQNQKQEQEKGGDKQPGAVDVQRGTVVPASAQVEHVTIKKKPKCKCCVIQ